MKFNIVDMIDATWKEAIIQKDVSSMVELIKLASANNK